MIDPVRFIGNYSSGKMGYAIAEELALRGAHVVLISGPVSISAKHQNIERVNVTSAVEMYEKCQYYFHEANGAVMCAAVADYAPVQKSSQKIKRDKEKLTIEMKPNPDIAACLGRVKRRDQFLVGFALETHDERENAARKLKAKNLDMIVLNSLNDAGAGFQTDTNKITIIDKHNNSYNFELKSKAAVAIDIVDRIIEKMAL